MLSRVRSNFLSADEQSATPFTTVPLLAGGHHLLEPGDHVLEPPSADVPVHQKTSACTSAGSIVRSMYQVLRLRCTVLSVVCTYRWEPSMNETCIENCSLATSSVSTEPTDKWVQRVVQTIVTTSLCPLKHDFHNISALQTSNY